MKYKVSGDCCVILCPYKVVSMNGTTAYVGSIGCQGCRYHISQDMNTRNIKCKMEKITKIEAIFK